MRRLAVPCVVSAMILGTLAVPTQSSTPATRHGIEASIDTMREAFQRGDSKRLASFYTEDADLVGSVSLRGRAAIERNMIDIRARGIRSMMLEGQEVFPGQDYTTATGRAIFLDQAGNRVATLSYMTLWRLDGGTWKIHRDVSFPVSFDAAALARMAGASRFRIEESAAVHAVVLPMKGSYRQHGEAIARLAVALEAAGVRPEGSAFGRYFNSRDDVPEASLEWEVGFEVPEGTQAPAPFELRVVEGGTVAAAIIAGPHETTERPWTELVQWAEKQGYQVLGPALERWQPGPRTEMRIPIRK